MATHSAFPPSSIFIPDYNSTDEGTTDDSESLSTQKSHVLSLLAMHNDFPPAYMFPPDYSITDEGITSDLETLSTHQSHISSVLATHSDFPPSFIFPSDYNFTDKGTTNDIETLFTQESHTSSILDTHSDLSTFTNTPFITCTYSNMFRQKYNVFYKYVCPTPSFKFSVIPTYITALPEASTTKDNKKTF